MTALCLSTFPPASLSNHSLPTSIAKLSMLKSLAIDNNLLAALSPRVCDLSSLERLTVDNNQLRFLPPKLGDLPALTLCGKASRLSEYKADFFGCTTFIPFHRPISSHSPLFSIVISLQLSLSPSRHFALAFSLPLPTLLPHDVLY